VSTLAGDGTQGFLDGAAASAKFTEPQGVFAGPGGNIYVADEHRIRLIAGGQVTTIAGSTPGYIDGPSASALFNQPLDVAVDAAGQIYVADSNMMRIRLIAGGQVSTFAGDGTKGFLDGPVAWARFHLPSGVAVDGAGRVYVADEWNLRVRVIFGGWVATLAGDSSGAFGKPRRIAVDGAGKVYVADPSAHRIRLVTPSP
jgi:hypothetical protein